MAKWGKNKKQFMIERTILCAGGSVSALATMYMEQYVHTVIMVVWACAFIYIYPYRMFVKKNWYKPRVIMPIFWIAVVLALWHFFPFIPPDPDTKSFLLPFITSIIFLLASIVDYRVYFGLLKEDNPKIGDSLKDATEKSSVTQDSSEI